MAKEKRVIECSSCGFEGTLVYSDEAFSPSDVSYCPVCGGDISEEYNIADDEMEDEE